VLENNLLKMNAFFDLPSPGSDGGPVPGPDGTTDLECTVDGELCDSNTCKPGLTTTQKSPFKGCRVHPDCEDDHYCSCGAANGGTICPEPGPVGTCTEGCRDLVGKSTLPLGNRRHLGGRMHNSIWCSGLLQRPAYLHPGGDA
jgi:hypothetical protein